MAVSIGGGIFGSASSRPTRESTGRQTGLPLDQLLLSRLAMIAALVLQLFCRASALRVAA
jgi:hypothetical protein